MVGAHTPPPVTTLPSYEERKTFFEEIVNGSPDPVELLRAGDRQAVVELIASRQAAVPVSLH